MWRKTNRGDHSSTNGSYTNHWSLLFLFLLPGGALWAPGNPCPDSGPESSVSQSLAPVKEGYPMSEISKARHVTTPWTSTCLPSMQQPRFQQVVSMAVIQGKARLSFGQSQTPGHTAAAPCMCLAPKAKCFHSVPAVLKPHHSSTHVPNCPFPESHPEPEPLALGLISKYATAPVFSAALGRRPQNI